MLGSVFEIAFVDSTIWHLKSSKAIDLIIQKVALVLDAIRPFEYAFTLSHTIYPAALINIPIWPDVSSLRIRFYEGRTLPFRAFLQI